MTREEAIEAIDHIMYSSPHESTEQIVKKKYYAELLKEYIADTAKVVRCEHCIHYNAGFECLKEGYGIECPPDYFCGDGKRKE